MKHTSTLIAAILAVAAAAASVPVAGVAGRPRVTITQAGPWYTPAELKALIAYSNASFEEKQAILAGVDGNAVTPTSDGVPLAGPWSAPETAGETGFHWSDAGIGGAAGFVVAVLAAGSVVLVRGRRQPGRPTSSQ